MNTKNNHFALPKADLPELIRKLEERFECYGPVPRAGKTMWARISDPQELDLQTLPTPLSPKGVFFPQTETLMRFKTRPGEHEDGSMQEQEPPARPVALLGIRPCDARAFALLDAIFCQDSSSCDPYWTRRRKDAFLVGLACDSPGPACFCTAVGGGPFESEGLDMLLTDVGEEYLLTTLTPRCASFVQGFEPARSEQLEQARSMREQAETCLPAENLAERVAERPLPDLYEAGLWDRIAETCLNCGACTFCCPTCHCFDIQDETQGPGGRRLRVWDTCMAPLFTRHASGHNPRGTKTGRVRQRFLHKLKYIPDRSQGIPGCVGCGRCVLQCPVNIDIREVMRKLAQSDEQREAEPADREEAR